MEPRKLVLHRGEEGVSPVIATILMVAITVVLAAVLYVMVSNLIVPPTENIIVTFGPPEAVGEGDWTYRVLSINGPRDFAIFRVSVLEDGVTVLGPADLVEGAPIPGMGSSGDLHLNLSDLDGSGRLSGGDTFTLGNADSGTIYTVVLFTKAGGEVTRTRITT